MHERILKKLQKGRRGERMAAWRDLACELQATHGDLSAEDARKLIEILEAEEDEGVQRCAEQAMNRLTWFCAMTHTAIGLANPERTESLRPRAERTLDNWFSDLFRRPSALLSIQEQNFHRRDEDALAHVARRFPPWIYQSTDLRLVPLNDERWFQLLLQPGYETILLIGRLWMFGQRALEHFVQEKLHFQFPSKTRPPNLEYGSLDPDYHCIHERNGGRKPHVYRTKDKGKIRTDFGLVQVHPVSNGRPMTAVLCGGCSSLGTLGAARWLTYDLGWPYNPNGRRPIPAPPGIGPESRMEALIEVTADSTDYGWDPTHIALSRLYVDDQVWSPDDWQWQFARRPVITVVMNSDGPTALWMNEEKIRMKSDSQNFRLAARLASQVKKSPNGSVSVEALANDQYIWNTTVDKRTVKKRLHNINHKSLKGIIEVDDEVRLLADVIIKRA